MASVRPGLICIVWKPLVLVKIRELMVRSLSTTLLTVLLLATVPEFPNTTSLEAPGGPLPPAVRFVQFASVDQLLEPVQSIVPGSATTLPTTSATVLVAARLPLVAVNVNV